MEVRSWVALRSMSKHGVLKWITVTSGIRETHAIHSVEVRAIMREGHPGHTVSPLIESRIDNTLLYV